MLIWELRRLAGVRRSGNNVKGRAFWKGWLEANGIRDERPCVRCMSYRRIEIDGLAHGERITLRRVRVRVPMTGNKPLGVTPSGR